MKNKLLATSVSTAILSLLPLGAYSAIEDGIGTIDITMNVATNGPEASLQLAFLQMCVDPGTLPAGRLQDICQALTSAAPGLSDDAYRQLSARSVSAVTSLLSHGSLIMSMEDISSRLAALRRAARSQNTAALDPWGGKKNQALAALLSDEGGNASGDNNSIAQSYFVSATHIGSEQKETDTVAGFDSDMVTATIGMDYRFSRQMFAGFATRLLSGDTTLNNNGGSLSSRDTNLTYYASYFPSQNVYLEATIRASRGFYDLSRKIDFSVGGVTVQETTQGTTRGSQAGFTLGTGYEQYFSSLATTAQFSAKYVNNSTHLEAYRESGAGAVNLAIDSQTIKTQMGSVGVSLSKAISFSGGVAIPQLDLVWKHDFETDGTEVGASFISDPNGTRFVYRTDERDSDYQELSFGVSVVTTSGTTSFFQYTSLLGYDNFEQGLLSLGVRKEF